ncbi:MAG: response regulator [Chitinispirillia bacterium]|nr:response regulator [Chitinispirillia bacterium]MCL2241574.1 response regulator [Chitinispirillia bacterium]
MSYSKEKTKKILVVDDEIDVLEFLKIYIETMGWEVTTAPTVTQALEELGKQPYFLVITDIAMPDMDGYEFISAIKSQGFECQFALMTGFGYNPKHTLVKIYKTVKYPLLFKPFNREKVTEAINWAYGKYHRDIDGCDIDDSAYEANVEWDTDGGNGSDDA